ncbi:MAG TPA: diguanylate cyclase [Phycisphaerae bacterium]|nr:diguanylate cyclase [Phycisphaerae bacterium]HRW51884.1 diguanylate cyclase [Phycisphaerae bacterium]
MVLIINDDKDVANEITTLLRAAGFRTIIAENEDVGLTIAERYAPNAVLLDVDNGGHRGLDLCRDLKSRIMTADTPVLFTTQNIQNDEIVEQCFDVGANDVIAKPIRKTLMLARINVALREANLREEYKRLALTDQATGLDNRRQFFMHVTESITSSQRRERDVYLMICDIDRLSAVNTEHGYDLGDEIIIMLARLAKRLVSMECRVGRIAGDAIGIVLKHSDEATADATASRILRTFEAIAFDAGTSPKHFTLSVGMARRIHDVDKVTPDELMARADIALAVAKTQGGRQIARHWMINDERLAAVAPTTRHARQSSREPTHRGSISVEPTDSESTPPPVNHRR